MREKLNELMKSGYRETVEIKKNLDYYMTVEEQLGIMTNYLIKNGVVVLLRDGNDFNPDVYCPYCGNNLTVAWEEKENENP